MTRVAEIKTPQEYAALHKRAFREGFDFLNAHFPPEFNSEWWDKAYQDLKVVADKNKGNRLLTEMLVGIVTYLEDESRMRRVDAEC